MLTAARDIWRAARTTVLACALAFVLGVLSVDHPDPDPQTAPVATITDRSVRRLAAALEAATRPEATTTAPTALVDEATHVLDQVREGTVNVTPEPTTPWQPPPTTTTTTTTPATTTTSPPGDATLHWPATTTTTVP